MGKGRNLWELGVPWPTPRFFIEGELLIGSEIVLKENVPLAPMTTIGIGGPARFYTEVSDPSKLKHAIDWAREQNLPFFILGGGSNLLVSDGGFQGLVISVAMLGIDFELRQNDVILDVMAGEVWDRVAAFAVANNWAGIECLSGIPGKVGAAPVQNIGAYGQEISETLVAVDALDLETMEMTRLSCADCGFGYRDSIFKGNQRDRYVITGIQLKLKADGPPTLRYGELQQRFTSQPNLEQVREAVLEIRKKKSMVFTPADPNAKGCGSFFLNPVLTHEQYGQFKEKCHVDHPLYPVGEARVKLSAAWLIEQSGFTKGMTMGGVKLSLKHCLAIVNGGGGTAKEVRTLVARIQKTVKARFGVDLVPEPVILGARGRVL